MTGLTRKAASLGAGIGMAALLAGLAPGAAAQQQAVTAPAGASDTLIIPDTVKILGAADLGTRRATAIVNGTLITGTDVDQRMALLKAANGQDIPADQIQPLRLTLLRSIIDETLEIQAAKGLKHEVGRDEIDAQYARIAREKFKMEPAELDRFLDKAGSSPQSLRRQVEGELAWDWLLRNDIAPFVNISAGEVTELYQRQQAAKGSTEYRIAEIFLSDTPATHDAVQQNAKRIVDQIRQNGNVATFARQFSEASTAAVGGDLGWIRLEQLQNPQLEQVAAGLNPGQLVGPVEVPGGFDILYLVDKRQVGMADPRDAILSLKQISLEFPAGTTEADASARALVFQNAIKEMHGCGDVETVAGRIKAEVVINDQVRVRDLPDALQQLMLQLSVGQATPPFGSLKEGVRALMLCGRDDPQATAGPNPEQLMAQLEDDRIQKRAQRYLRDLRRDAVIEYN